MDLANTFWASPPVTRTYAAAIFAVSVTALVGIISPYRLLFDWSFIFSSIPQIWRFVTSFCYTSGLGILYTPYFVWTYGGALETGSSRFDSASLLVYYAFVGSIITGLSNTLFGSPMFLNSMVLALIYTYAQENRGQSVNFFFINAEIRYLPYLMLLLTFVQGGPIGALNESTGIVAAHLYDFLTLYWPRQGGGPSLIKTPSFVRQWFSSQSGAKNVTVKSHGTAYHPTPAAQAASSGSSWTTRGQGRRLGGD